MKVFKISLISLIFILVVTFSTLTVCSIYKYYNGIYEPNIKADQIFDADYTDKETYLEEYTAKIYPIHKVYPLILNVDNAVKEDEISYSILIELIPSYCINRNSSQTFYVYDESLGYDTTSPDNNYSFKVEFWANYFSEYSLEEVDTEISFNTTSYYCDYDFKIRYYKKNTSSTLGCCSTQFHTNLELSQEYCEKFVNDNLTFLNL